MFELMGLISWILMGLLAGAAAKILVPGEDPGGLFVTLLIGIAGAVIGGMISTFLGFGGISGFDVRSLIVAVLGGMVLLVALRILGIKKREKSS